MCVVWVRVRACIHPSISVRASVHPYVPVYVTRIETVIVQSQIFVSDFGFRLWASREEGGDSSRDRLRHRRGAKCGSDYAWLISAQHPGPSGASRDLRIPRRGINPEAKFTHAHADSSKYTRGTNIHTYVHIYPTKMHTQKAIHTYTKHTHTNIETILTGVLPTVPRFSFCVSSCLKCLGNFLLCRQHHHRVHHKWPQ